MDRIDPSTGTVFAYGLIGFTDRGWLLLTVLTAACDAWSRIEGEKCLRPWVPIIHAASLQLWQLGTRHNVQSMAIFFASRYRGLGCRVFRNETRMSYGYDSLEDVLACLKRMESIVLGLKQLRNFVSQGAGVEILDSVIAEAESQIEEIRRKVIV